MRVVFFHRKPYQGNYSMESLFAHIRLHLPPDIQWNVKELSYHSQGFFKRLFISLEAMFNQADINHITGDVNFIALFLNKRKTVLTIHDVGYMKQNNPLFRFLLLWIWIKLPVKRSACVTVVSEATKNELLRYTGKDAEKKIKIVHVPTSEQYVASPREFNKQMPVILQIGTKHNKNILRLIAALKGITCRLEIVGAIDAKTEHALKEASINYQCSGNLSDKEMFEKYYQADIVTFVSTYEGFGMPIVEANAMGRVVITSSILSMPEVAGDAAHLVDPYDVDAIHQGISQLIADDTYREQLIFNGYRNALRFSVSRIAGEYASLYRTLKNRA